MSRLLSLTEPQEPRRDLHNPHADGRVVILLGSSLDMIVAEPPPSPTPRVRGPRSRRVLVIEDNKDAALTLGEYLELSDFEVEIAFDGPSGVEAAHRFRPALVISDIGLPGQVDGYQVARLLRSAECLPTPWLIAMSGYADEASRQRALESGFDDYFPKPFDIDHLVVMMDELLEDRQQA